MNIFKQNLFFLMFLFSVISCLSAEENKDPYWLQKSYQETLDVTGAESDIRLDGLYDLSSSELEEYTYNQVLLLSTGLEEDLMNLIPRLSE